MINDAFLCYLRHADIVCFFRRMFNPKCKKTFPLVVFMTQGHLSLFPKTGEKAYSVVKSSDMLRIPSTFLLDSQRETSSKVRKRSTRGKISSCRKQAIGRYRHAFLVQASPHGKARRAPHGRTERDPACKSGTIPLSTLSPLRRAVE